jgi:hypothetical protein
MVSFGWRVSTFPRQGSRITRRNGNRLRLRRKRVYIPQRVTSCNLWGLSMAKVQMTL